MHFHGVTFLLITQLNLPSGISKLNGSPWLTDRSILDQLHSRQPKTHTPPSRLAFLWDWSFHYTAWLTAIIINLIIKGYYTVIFKCELLKTKSHLIELCGCVNKFKGTECLLWIYYEFNKYIPKLSYWACCESSHTIVTDIFIYYYFFGWLSLGICFCRCIFPHKLLTYVPAVTGKCSKYGPCQEFSTRQYSAPVSIYDALCASDLLSIIMQQKDGHNCWITRFNWFGMSRSLLATGQQTFITG